MRIDCVSLLPVTNQFLQKIVLIHNLNFITLSSTLFYHLIHTFTIGILRLLERDLVRHQDLWGKELPQEAQLLSAHWCYSSLSLFSLTFPGLLFYMEGEWLSVDIDFYLLQSK